MKKRISLSFQRNSFECLIRELKDAQSDYGSSLKDFRILSELGRGSYGIAYKVEALLNHGCIYVLKKIPIRHVKPKHQRDALQEVLILRKMTHPYIIRYYTSFIEEDCLYILMEYAAGGDLHKLIRNQKENGKYFSEMEIWKFAFQIGLGLEYLHSQKIIHRDVKCLNIFLTENNTIKIGDLGVSRILSNAKLLQGTHVGTPLYLSPELIKQQPYDYKIDIWAMGIVLYYLAALEPPFKGDNLTSLAKNIVNEAPKALSRGYSSTLQNYIDRLLAKRAAERPNTKEMLKMIPALIKKELYEKPNAEKNDDNDIENNSGSISIRPLEDKDRVKLLHVASQKKVISEDEKNSSQYQPPLQPKEKSIVFSNIAPIKEEKEEQQASVHPEKVPLFHKRHLDNTGEEFKPPVQSLVSDRPAAPSVSLNMRRKRIIITSNCRAETAAQKTRPTLSALLQKNCADTKEKFSPTSQRFQEDPSRPNTANFPAFLINQNEPRLSSASQISRPRYNREEIVSSGEDFRPNTAFSLCSQQGQILPKISSIIPHINHFGSMHGEMKPILSNSKSAINYMTLREHYGEQRFGPQHPSIIERKKTISILRPGQKKLTVTDLS